MLKGEAEQKVSKSFFLRAAAHAQLKYCKFDINQKFPFCVSRASVG